MNGAYAELEKRVKAGGLRLISLLAPARSSSTALERALLGSPGIDLQVNDPFAIYDDAAREENTYQYILDRIEADGAGKTPLTVLVKNVADYIPPGESWRRWRDLCKRHVFLVRNPLLTMHSLFRMLIRHFDASELNEAAQRGGYTSGATLQNALADGDDFSAYEDLFRTLFTRDQKIHREPVMRLPVLGIAKDRHAHDAGFKSLDDLAGSIGDANWQETLARAQEPGADLARLAPLFARLFGWRITGWEALDEHFRDTPGAIVMDSTMFRSAPEDAMRSLSRALGIDYADDMRDWGGVGKTFTTDYDGPVPYYDRVTRSQKIDPPVEKPLPLSAFPPFFREHLAGAGGCLEIYVRLLRAIDPAFACAFQPSAALQEIDPVFCFALATARCETPAPVDPRFADAAAAISRLA